MLLLWLMMEWSVLSFRSYSAFSYFSFDGVNDAVTGEVGTAFVVEHWWFSYSVFWSSDLRCKNVLLCPMLFYWSQNALKLPVSLRKMCLYAKRKKTSVKQENSKHLDGFDIIILLFWDEESSTF